MLLRPAPEARYIIVHGERRWRAAQALGWETIPAEVRELSADEAHWISLVENMQRADLSPIEAARAYQERLSQGLTQANLAKRIGKDRSSMAQKLRLLTLPAPLTCDLERKALSEGHARQLLKIREWDGQEICRAFRRRAETQPAHDWDFTEAKQVQELMDVLKIEDFPDWWITFFKTTSAAAQAWVAAGCRAFWQDLQTPQFHLPQWEVSAFWWASAAVWGEQSVTTLAQAIDRWQSRLLSAIAWMEMSSPESKARECPYR